QDCLQNHPECQPMFKGSYFPTRLLDLGQQLLSSEPPKLVETKNGIGTEFCSPAYATLSHCWGNSQPLRLLMQNKLQHLQGIPLSALPRVFSEAMTVCRNLGIRYLWIDSLCICQDSEEDWAQESALMGAIYSHAILNIAATGS
ncbi:heterokaryon incompatibility protein-domain-containing protein, partial [Clohesyomyces aquaticus]